MTESVKLLFCGPPGNGLNWIVGTKNANDVYSHFDHKQAIYVHKGRTAIRLACRLLGLGANNEILAPAYNCGSEIDALLSSGTSVVLYRIDRACLADLADLEKRITSRTKAIYVTHYFGFPQSTAAIQDICVRHGLYMIEDCALALFSEQDDEMLGKAGDVSVFSLPKTLPVPDGGVLLVNNVSLQGAPLQLSHPESITTIVAMLPGLKSAAMRWLSGRTSLYPLCKSFVERKYTEHARGAGAWSAEAKPNMPSSYYYDEKLSDKEISFYTRRMLRTINPQEIAVKRRKNFSGLLSLLDQNPHMKPIFRELPGGVCPLSFPIIVEHRDHVRLKLREFGIDAGVWWKGYHRNLPWNDFPEACFLKDHVLTLPVHQDLDEREVSYIAEKVREVLTSF